MVALGSPRPQTRSLNGRAYVASWHNATDADALILWSVLGALRTLIRVSPRPTRSSLTQLGHERAGFAAVQGVFRPKTRVSPRWVTAGRTLERRHCLPGLHQHRVEITAASAVPSDLHWQLDDRGGDLRQCLNALCSEFRFGHGGLSRFGFERCHGSSGAVRRVCVLAEAALVQSPVMR
jgi:hypothetical protein